MHFGITEKPTTWASSLTFPKNSQRKRWKLPFSTTPLSFDVPSPGNLREYPHKPYIARNQRHWLTFCHWPYASYLHSNFCGRLRKTHLFCNRVRIGRSRPSEVVDFGTNRKGVRKQNLTWNNHSKSFKAMHSGITEKPARDSVSLYRPFKVIQGR